MPSRRSTPDATDADPRLTDEYVRTVSGGEETGDVVLTGVVHDHPASAYRTKTLIEALDPDVLALELPPMAVPLFGRYADDSRTPPAFGGEMSTAIQATGTDHVVGIDGPSIGFTACLVRTLYRERAGLDTLRRVSRSLRSITGRAVLCRLAATMAGVTGLRLEVDDPVSHDVRWSDDPSSQAADEREQVRRARAVTAVFGRTDAVRLREGAREEHMADRLCSLRRAGDVVAVVGIDHLDSLAERLGSADATSD